MNGRSIRAKLSGVRALSTILIALALAHPAGAQVFGASSRYTGPSWWVGGMLGKSERQTMSDRATGGRWILEPATPVRVQVARGDAARTVGLTVSYASIPTSILTISCIGCRARVSTVQALGTYRTTGAISTTRYRHVVEFGGGVTRWSRLSGRDADRVPAVAANIDLTFAASIGIALPLGDDLELSVSYDITALVHEKEQGAFAGPGTTAKVNIPTLQVGGRLRLDRWSTER
jgi:hypothetical protein